MDVFRIGSGAGYSGDRIDPARDLAILATAFLRDFREPGQRGRAKHRGEAGDGAERGGGRDPRRACRLRWKVPSISGPSGIAHTNC